MIGVIDIEREARWLRAIARSNEDPIPRGIALRIRCGERDASRLLQRLYREIELVAPLLARDREVVQLAFSGAADATLSPQQRSELRRSLARNFTLADRIEPGGAPGAAAPAATALAMDVLGLGPGAISRFGGVSAINASDPDAYCRALDAGHLPVIECAAAPA